MVRARDSDSLPMTYRQLIREAGLNMRTVSDFTVQRALQARWKKRYVRSDSWGWTGGKKESLLTDYLAE